MPIPSQLFPIRAGKPRALVNIKMREVSGVDHPATMMEGWMLMKAALPNGMSYQELLASVKHEMCEAMPTLSDADFWIEELYSDHAVICMHGKYFDVPYTLADDGTITVDGQPTEVERHTTWEADVEKSEEFAKMVEDEETMVKAHEVLGQLLVTIASEGTYLADAPEDVRKSAESLFSWLQTEGFIDESVTAKFAPSEHEPAQRRFMKVFSRLASMFKGETAAQDDDEAIMAALEDAMPRFAAGVRLIKTSTATPAQKRAGIAYLIDDLNQTITKHGKFKHDNKVHARASAAATS